MNKKKNVDDLADALKKNVARIKLEITSTGLGGGEVELVSKCNIEGMGDLLIKSLYATMTEEEEFAEIVTEAALLYVADRVDKQLGGYDKQED